MIVLVLAYGVLEEGIRSSIRTSRLRLCAIPWTTFVLTIHTVWSISVPIALIEVLGPQIRSPTDVLITH
ncbi:MAG: hypothetical protein ACOX8D_05875 [Methanoculleus sp.]|jgi:hypothetical protein